MNKVVQASYFAADLVMCDEEGQSTYIPRRLARDDPVWIDRAKVHKLIVRVDALNFFDTHLKGL